jgi:MFS family permease
MAALVAGAFAITMLGTTLPTPLYPLYQEKYGFGGLTVTVVFAVYAVGVGAALIVFGQLSDRVGRRPILAMGLALSAASAVVFLLDGVFSFGLGPLFVGRLLSGFSAGVFTGTATATIVEMAPAERRSRASLLAAAVNMGGLGLGPILAGTLAQFAPAPLVTCFAVDLALVAVAALAIWVIPETVKRTGPVRLTIQRVQVPAGVRGVFVRAGIAGFVGFAVLGLFTAVSPSMLGEILHRHNAALTGLVVFTLFAASVVGQTTSSLLGERRSLLLGCVGLVAGMGLVAASLEAASLGLLIAAAVVSGIGQGMSFRAGLQAVNAGSPPEQRSEVASAFFLLLYVGITVPVIGVGAAADAYGLLHAGVVFSIGAAALAAVAFVALAQHLRPGREVR